MRARCSAVRRIRGAGPSADSQRHWQVFDRRYRDACSCPPRFAYFFFFPFSFIAFLVYSIAGGGWCVWQGYKWADRSAEITALDQKITDANATIATLRKRAASDAAAVNAYAQREELANEALEDMQEAIDALDASKAALPAADVCRLSPDDARRLRDIAKSATHHRSPASPGSVDVRTPR